MAKLQNSNEIHFCVALSSVIFTRLKYKTSCTEQLTATLCRIFTQYDLHIKQTLVSHFFEQLAKILDMFSA